MILFKTTSQQLFAAGVNSTSAALRIAPLDWLMMDIPRDVAMLDESIDR